MGMGHHEALLNFLIKRLVPSYVKVGAGAINSYETAILGSGVDTWSDGESTTKFQWQKGVIMCDVGELLGTSLTLALYDDDAQLTNANGAANANLVFTLAPITEAGLYVAEFSFGKVFASTLARVVANADANRIQRYLSLRATAAGNGATFSAHLILWGNLGGFPVNGTVLAKTWASS